MKKKFKINMDNNNKKPKTRKKEFYSITEVEKELLPESVVRKGEEQKRLLQRDAETKIGAETMSDVLSSL